MVLINEIKPTTQFKKKKRIGRGGKRGTYSGRGVKGQKARAGARIKSEKKEAVLKIPQKRGLKFRGRPEHLKKPVVILNLEEINKAFKAGERVNWQTLLQRGLVKKEWRTKPRVKILAKGKLTKKLIFQGCLYSAGAKQLIEGAGGVIR